MTTESQPAQPEQPAQPSAESIFVISYDRSAGLTDAAKTAAEALLGKVVWFEVAPGARMPQVTVFTKESR